MYTLVIGVVSVLGLVVLPIVSKSFLEKARDQRDGREWLIKHGTQVEATLTQVQTLQDWHYTDRFQRDPYDGNWQQERLWQTCYRVTAQWVHSQTGHLYLVQTQVWADDCPTRPVEGDFGTVWFDPESPERSFLELPLSGARSL